MVHMRCKHLHSEIRQNVNQRIIQQWRSLLLAHNCQTRLASTVVTRSKKAAPNLLPEVDSLEHLRQIKSSARRRIPVHVSTKIDKQLPSPTTMTIQSHLSNGDVESAWKLVDKSASYLTQQNIPRLTAQLLLKSLHTQVNANLPRLTLDFSKLQQLYLNRLEILTAVVRKSKDIAWDKHEISMVLELYGKLDHIKRAESLFRNIAHYTAADYTPSLEVYNQMMAVYVRRFKYVDDTTKKRYFSKMKTLEQEMIRKGLQPDTCSYNILLAAKIKSHDLQGAEAIYSKMTTPPDRTTYNILLNGYLKDCRNNKDKEITQQWMERLIASGIVPNRRTFNSIMDGLASQVVQHARLKEISDMQGTAQSVSSLYKVMRRLGHKPDTEIVNTLLKCYTAAGDIDHIEKVLDMLVLPEKKGCGGNCACASKASGAAAAAAAKPKFKVKPDTYTFNMLIKYHLGNNNTELAFQMYDTMVNLKLDPDTVTYGNFIWYYASQGNATEALKYVDVMQRKGIPSNNYIYNTLLNYSLKYPKDAYLITPHLQRMIADGSSTLDSVSSRISIARFQYVERDNVESNFERFTDVLENIYAAPEISTRTYNTILQSTGKFYKPKHSSHVSSINLENIIESLDTSHLTPDIYTFALSIRNAAYVGNMVKAESIYKTMVDSGIKPNHFVFSHLIHGYVSLGKMDKASDLLQHMANYQLRPTALHYAPLIKGFAESAEFDQAYELFRDMLANKVNADLVIYTILASVFLESPRGNEARAIDLLEGIEKAGIPMDAASLTLLAKAYAIQGSKKAQLVYTEKIDRIYQTFKENHWLDAKAITTLLTAHHRMKNPDAAWKLWNTLQEEKTLLTTLHYNALMASISSTKTWYPLAKLVFEEMLQDPKVAPDAHTFDLMIWGAYGVSDLPTIQHVWHARQPDKVLFVRSYYAVMKAMLECNDIDGAQRVYEEYQKLPSTPSSTTVWVGMINKLAAHQGFSKSTSTST
ncbi:hypothetical protein V8B55DRAFT_1520856 [Mucor lusitanicus]|uniref:PROP1-like PPR domain-containing protein n=1 Tax=Mucor circinelloides f. lusitanicus TaxID=29924 RepID=A0A8H4BBM8_MUCCL|nr:hypothetical protein FB192DRAFT_1461272 [Mucor lusitanicus]